MSQGNFKIVHYGNLKKTNTDKLQKSNAGMTSDNPRQFFGVWILEFQIYQACRMPLRWLPLNSRIFFRRDSFANSKYLLIVLMLFWSFTLKIIHHLLLRVLIKIKYTFVEKYVNKVKFELATYISNLKYKIQLIF